MIFNSNFQMGLIKTNLLSTNNKLIIFVLYLSIFVIGSTILLNLTYSIRSKDRTGTDLFYTLAIYTIYSVLSISLILTTLQMFMFNSYSNSIFYIASYLSFISSFFFLSILSLKFFRLYLAQKNYFVILYAILFVIYCCSILVALIYLVNGLSTHPATIKPVFPRVLIANTYSVNVIFQNNLGAIYDVLFVISFVLAWFLSTMILKQYSRRIGKYTFWFLVSIPLFLYLTRYETINLFGQDVFFSESNVIPASISESIFNTFKNANIQLGGVFFGVAFLIIALKIKNNQLRRTIIIAVIGIMLLFGSRDLHSIFVSSFPPGGVVTISFMSIGSYMLLFGLFSFVKLATRDRELYIDLMRQIDANTMLKSLITSEKEIKTVSIVKPLIERSIQWQKENSQEEMKIEEIKEIVNDVVSEVRNLRYNNIDRDT
jgi:hypothetical protein